MQTVPRARSRRVAVAVLAVATVAGFLVLGPSSPAGASPPSPVATLGVPPTAFIGEPFAFTVTFDNADTTDAGYGPYLDVYLPTNGADGAVPPQDGLSFVNATYQGTAVQSQLFTFPVSGTIVHPLTGATITGVPGDQFVVLTAPFGSFTPTQPAATVTVNTTLSGLADVGTPLPIKAVAGFRFGNSPTGSTPIVQSPPVTATTTPTLVKLTKTYNGPENETATGPNFPRSYTITADVAAGQTITNLRLTDVLPNTLAYLGVTGISPAGSATTQPALNSVNNPPASTVTVTFPTVTGGAGATDASFTVNVFVARVDANNVPVIDPVTAAFTNVNDTASAVGSWVPLDPRDPPLVNAALGSSNTVPLQQQSIAARKSVTNVSGGAVKPGTVLEYAITVDVSDYFAWDDVVATDTFSDGQSLDGSFTPTLTRTQHGVTDPVAPFAPANWGPPSGTGPTVVGFRISDELAGTTTGRRFLGGCVPNGGTGILPPSCAVFNGGPTTAVVTFRTIVDLTYDGGQPVIEGDTLGDSAVVSGLNLATSNLASTGNTVTDDTAASVELPKGTVAKSIYALNGNTSVAPSPMPISAGDQVTYRLRYTLPQSRHNGLVLDDYLPLPMFSAAELTTVDPGGASAAVPVAGHVKLGPTDTYSALAGSLPALATNPVGNDATFTYPPFAATPPQASTVDVLFTVTASGSPFADGLLFTNQVQSTQTKTDGSTVQGTAITQVERLEPALRITKGAVRTDATGTPAATFAPAAVAPAANVPFTAVGSAGKRFPGTISSSGLATQSINSNLTNVDGGDIVTFAVVVENTGRGNPYKVSLRDTMPPGMQVPATAAALNFRVQDGTGALMGFTNIGTGYFDPAGGIQLTDPGPTVTPPGAIDPCVKASASAACLDPSGRNLAVITYDLQLTSAVQPNQILTNTATLFSYQGCPTGPACVNYLDPTGSNPKPLSDTATVQVRNLSVTKTIATTSEPSTTFTPTIAQATIGEIVRYRVQVRMPEGSATNLQLRDAVPAGMTFLNDGTAKIAFVSTVSPGGFTSTTITPAATSCTPVALNPAGNEGTVGTIVPTCVLPAAAISPVTFNDGDDPTFSLGDTTISDNDTNQEFVVLEYNGLVSNVAINQANQNRDNTVSVSVNGAALANSTAARASIREPIPALSKCLQSDAVCAVPTNPTADAGDVVAFRAFFSQPNGGARSPAFDVRILDALDTTKYTLVPGSVVITLAGGAAGPVVDNTAGNTVDVSVASVPSNAAGTVGSVTVDYQVTVVSTIAAGTYTNANTAQATWTSLPGSNGTTPNPTGSVTPGTPGSPTGERDGVTPPASLNDYRLTSSRNLIVPTTATKTVTATSEADTTPVALVDRVAVGEIVRYRLVSQVPEGTTPSLEMFDNIPNGLSYISGTAKVALVSGTPMTSAAPTFSPTGTPAVGLCPVGPCPGLQVVGDQTTVNTIVPTFAMPATNVTGGSGAVWGNSADATFALGNVTNPDNDPGQEFIVLEYNALVRNQTSNVTSANLSNAYTFRKRTAAATTVTLSGPASAPVVVAEPSITFSKTTDLVVSPDLNDTFNYQITIANGAGTNVSPAYNAVVTDTIPVQLTQTGVPTCTPAGGASACVHTGGNVVNEAIAVLPPGASVVISVPVKITGAVSPGQIITNNARASWTSLPGSNGTSPNPTGSTTPGAPASATGERTCSPLPTGTPPNTYCAGANVPVTIGNAALTKTVWATDKPQTTGTDVVPGETVTYDVGVTLPEGTTGAFTVTDAIPANMSYVAGSASIVTSGPPLPFPLNGTVTPAGTFVTGGASSGAPVTFNFTGANLVGDNDPTNNTFIIRYTVLVDQNAANTNNLVKTNTATISLPGVSSASASVTVKRVDLAITKSDGGISVGPNQNIPYTLNYSNVGGIVSTGVVITETVPARTVFRSALSTPGWSCADGSPATTVCTFSVGTLAVGASGSVVFGLDPIEPFVAPYLISNTTSITDDGASWVDANPADNVASDSTPQLDAFDNADVTDVNTPKIVNVLGNDVGYNPLFVTGSTPTQAGGTTVVNGNNTITYNPPLDYTGYDVFQYSITDGLGGVDTATVVIFIDADNVRKNDRMFYTGIGGTTPCTAPCTTPGTYEQIQVGGPVPLKAQELVITLRNGFFPTPGQTFDVFTAPSVTGNWARVYGQVQYDPATKTMIVFKVRILPDRVRLVATRSCPITSTADAPDATVGDGICADALGATTLRSVVQEAGSGSLGPETVVSLIPTTYNLTLPGAGGAAGDLDVAPGTDLAGNGAVIDAAGAGDRAIELVGGNALTGLTVRNGNAGVGDGGGILAAGGPTAFTDVHVQVGTAANGGGLAIAGGSATITRGSVVNSSAVAGSGGGIAVSGGASASIASTTMASDTASVAGGGLSVTGAGSSASLANVVISAGLAPRGGGLVVGGGATVTAVNTLLSGDTATVRGAGFAVDGSLALTDSRVTGNAAPDAAGGDAATGSVLTVTRVTFDGNATSGVGGGLSTDGTTTVATSTFSGNTASDAPAVSVGLGSTIVTSTTITANVVTGGALNGAVLVGGAASMTIGNSIVSNQVGGARNCSNLTTPASAGYNHADDTSCSLVATGDVQSGSANLGVLRLNGGFSPTHQPNLGSPVINSGDPTCTGQDQRGWLRPRGGACEKGSVER